MLIFNSLLQVDLTCYYQDNKKIISHFIGLQNCTLIQIKTVYGLQQVRVAAIKIVRVKVFKTLKREKSFSCKAQKRRRDGLCFKLIIEGSTIRSDFSNK